MAGEIAWISHCDDEARKESRDIDLLSEAREEFDKEETVISLDVLPDELLERILAYLPVASIFRARSVCKRWHEIVTSKRFLWNPSNSPAESTRLPP